MSQILSLKSLKSAENLVGFSRSSQHSDRDPLLAVLFCQIDLTCANHYIPY